MATKILTPRTLNTIAKAQEAKVNKDFVPYVVTELTGELHKAGIVDVVPSVTVHSTNNRIRVDVDGRPYASVDVMTGMIHKALGASARTEDARASLADATTWSGKISMKGFANLNAGRRATNTAE